MTLAPLLDKTPLSRTWLISVGVGFSKNKPMLAYKVAKPPKGMRFEVPFTVVETDNGITLVFSFELKSWPLDHEMKTRGEFLRFWWAWVGEFLEPEKVENNG